MKKRFLFSAGIGLVLSTATLMTSCDKSAGDVKPAAVSNHGTASLHSFARQYKANATWEGIGKLCSPAISNCTVLPPVVVTPHLESIRQAALDGTGSVGSLWSGNTIDDAKGAIEPSIVADLASGNYGMVETYHSGNSSTFIVGSRLPVTPTNMEYAIEIHVAP